MPEGRGAIMKSHTWRRVSPEIEEETQAIWKCEDCGLYDFNDKPNPAPSCCGSISKLIEHEEMMNEPKLTIDEFCKQTPRRTALADEFRKFCDQHKYKLEQYAAAWRKGWIEFEKEREA